MNQGNVATQVNDQYKQDGAYMDSRGEILDYDEHPYGDDNILVRSMRRRSLLVSTSEF